MVIDDLQRLRVDGVLPCRQFNLILFRLLRIFGMVFLLVEARLAFAAYEGIKTLMAVTNLLLELWQFLPSGGNRFPACTE